MSSGTICENYFWENDNPSTWVSMLIPCYNTKEEYLVSCIHSIKEQIGEFGIELVWINDCSTEENSQIQMKLLDTILKPLNNFKLVYQKTKINRGISFCLHQGLHLCSNEIVFRMDSDDIMMKHRIQKQLRFIQSTPSCVLCGTNIIVFQEIHNTRKTVEITRHKNILTWVDYKKNPTDWFLNHPTLCFKKAAILRVGNYRKNFRVPFEDLELELRVLKKYGVIYNIEEPLVLYRDHHGQISKTKTNIIETLKNTLIKEAVSSP